MTLGAPARLAVAGEIVPQLLRPLRVRPPLVRLLLVLPVLFLAHAVGGCAAEEGTSHVGKPPPGPLNVIVISIDTLNRDSLRAYDADAGPLPALDAFADASRRFQNAHSTASWTLPAHASLMTGLYPDRHGATARTQRLSANTTTMADCFRRAGYETVGFTEGGYLDEDFGFAKGFDRYDPPLGDGHRDSAGTAGESSDADMPWKQERRAGRPFQRALHFLAERPSDAPPLYLFLHTYLVHDYFKLRPWAVAATPTQQDRSRAYYLDCLRAKHACDPEDWARLRQLYHAGLTRVDQSFGKLLATLEQQGLRESTLIVVLSDHGEGFDPDHARIHHGGRLHADLIRIPLLIAGPGIASGDVDTPVSLVDIMPALLDHLALEGPTELDGVANGSLLPRAQGPDDPDYPDGPDSDRVLFAMEHYRSWGAEGLARLDGFRAEPNSIAVIDPDSWYIRDQTREEFYTMSSDPRQRHSLITGPGLPAAGATLREFARRRAEFSVKPQPRAIENGLENQLRSLGYVE